MPPQPPGAPLPPETSTALTDTPDATAPAPTTTATSPVDAPLAESASIPAATSEAPAPAPETATPPPADTLPAEAASPLGPAPEAPAPPLEAATPPPADTVPAEAASPLGPAPEAPPPPLETATPPPADTLPAEAASTPVPTPEASARPLETTTPPPAATLPAEAASVPAATPEASAPPPEAATAAPLPPDPAPEAQAPTAETAAPAPATPLPAAAPASPTDTATPALPEVRPVTLARPLVPGTVLVDVTTRRLIVATGARDGLSFPVTTARPNIQFLGETRVTLKRRDPTWTPTPNQRRLYRGLPGSIGPGRPDNPLGSRALNLAIGNLRIHGTNEPHEIGEPTSDGCIRLINSHVEQLFELVPVGARVIVTRNLDAALEGRIERVVPRVLAGGSSGPRRVISARATGRALIRVSSREVRVSRPRSRR